MDLSKLPNPFDFANPVSDPTLFAGRSDELEDVRYYLDHASRAGRAINLAIMGSRASGKTSFLNLIEMEAVKRGFCVVRVDLDESDVQTQLALFQKLFDALIMTVMDSGTYGGITGRTYDTYRDMVDAYEVPEDKTFCPFIFPVQYAKAMSGHNPDALLSDTGFRRDLRIISEEVKRPIAILFDECDVLAKSRIHLEKLRNIFMNTPGYMLVFTGTPALFPVMDDVFSPIVRQFKKIIIGPFDDQEDTETCIKKPLEKIGIKQVSSILDLETYFDIREIHNLSGGRPYEIQLICHFLFRRIQQNRAKRMELTLDVLDDVLKELQTVYGVSTRKVFNVVRELDKRQLAALGFLCRCDGYASLDQLWFAEYVLYGESRWTRNELEQHLADMSEAGIAKADDGVVKFLGSDFDRVYCKYFARKYGIHLSITDMPFEVALAINVDQLAMERISDLEVFPSLLLPGAEETDLRDVAEAFLKPIVGSERVADPLDTTPHLAEVVYWSSISFQDRGEFPVATVTVVAPGAKFRRWYGCGNTNSCSCETNPIGQLEPIVQVFQEASNRAPQLGGELRVDVEVMPTIPFDTLRCRVLASDNQRMREGLALRHMSQMTNAYIGLHDLAAAQFHGELAYCYDPNLDGPAANNLGYLFMNSGNYELALQLMTRAIETAEAEVDKALPVYNIAVTEALKGDFVFALEKLDRVIQLLADEDPDSTEMACLLVPTYNPITACLEFPEVFEPSLLESARTARTAICRASQQQISDELIGHDSSKLGLPDS